MSNSYLKELFISIIVVFITSLSCVSQALDGYKYLYLPPLTYTDGSVDKWGIAEKVSRCFEKKGFIIANNPNQLPSDYTTKEFFSILNCNIQHSADYCDMCYNHVTITLTNVLQETVLTLSGKGMGLTLQGDLNNATRNALITVERMSYHFDSEKSPQKKYPEVEKTNWTEQSIMHYLDTCTDLSIIEGIYKNLPSDNSRYYKIGIVRDGDLYKAIVLETEQYPWEPGEVKAVFETANLSLFSTKFYLGNKSKVETFATCESKGVLKIDLTKIGGDNLSFLKLYPIMKSNSQQPPQANPSNSVVASGTGFIISRDGYIATNNHVIAGSNRITVDMLKNDKVIQYEAEVVVTDAANDVAIIKIEDEAFTPFEKLPYTIESNINIGADVYTIGFPLNDVMGSNYKVTNGIISAKTGIDDDIRKYQITVPSQPGNSGGPLINKNGNVVGITSSSLNGNAVGTKIENVNYAVKSLYLLNAINMVPQMEDLPSKSSIADKNMEEQIAILKDYICLIKIY